MSTPNSSPDENKASAEKDTQKKSSQTAENVKSNFKALGEVGGLKRRIAGLEQELNDSEQKYAQDKDAYEKRHHIESNYTEIVSTRNQIIEDAQRNIEQQKQNIEQFEKELLPQKQQLEQIVKRHEREIQPYKERLEGAEAEYAQAETKVESVNQSLEGARKVLESTVAQIDEAIKQEAKAQSEIADINKAVMDLKNNGQSVDQAALQSQLAVAQMQLSSAQSTKNDATMRRSSAEQDVRNFQNDLNQAVTESSAKKNLLTSAQADFDKIAAEHANQQAPIRSIVEPLEKEIADAYASIDASNMQLQAAQEEITEANEVNDHPEITQQMKDALDALLKKIEALKAEIAELKNALEKASKSANRAKLLIVGIIVAAVVIVIGAIAAFGAIQGCVAEQERIAAQEAQQREAEARQRAAQEAKEKAEREEAEAQERARQEAIERAEDNGWIPIDSELLLAKYPDGSSVKLDINDDNEDGFLSPEELTGVFFNFKDQSTIDAIAQLRDLKDVSIYLDPNATGTLDISKLSSASTITISGDIAAGHINDSPNGNNVSAIKLPSNGTLNRLTIEYAPNVTSIENLEGCSGLSDLVLTDVGILALTLTGNVKLTSVEVVDCPLSSMSVDGLANLSSITVEGCGNLVSISALNTPRLTPPEGYDMATGQVNGVAVSGPHIEIQASTTLVR